MGPGIRPLLVLPWSPGTSNSNAAHPTAAGWRRPVVTCVCVHTPRVDWQRSARDEHRAVLALVASAVAFGLAISLLPRQADIVHTFVHGLGLMAPTCGLTRAGLALLRGDFPTAWSYNPAIFLVAPLASAVLVRFAVGMSRGRWLTVHLQLGAGGWAITVVLAFALWLNQQAHFALLVT